MRSSVLLGVLTSLTVLASAALIATKPLPQEVLDAILNGRFNPQCNLTVPLVRKAVAVYGHQYWAVRQ